MKTGKCEKCSPKCKTCSINLDKCTSCRSTDNRFLFDNSICKCNFNFYEDPTDKAVCLKCNDKCF